MALVSREGKLSIIGIFTTAYTANLPYTHPRMSVVLGLALEEVDLGQTVELTVELLDPDAQQLQSTRGVFDFSPDADLRGGFHCNFEFDLVELSQGGLHEFSIKINGSQASTLPLSVETRPR